MSTKNHVIEVVEKRLSEVGYFPLIINNSIIPPRSASTLFVCSGMQLYEDEYIRETGRLIGSLQSCIRVNDIEEIGDGTHLSSFHMIGCHAFKAEQGYEKAVEAWVNIVRDLQIPITHVEVHPTQKSHYDLFKQHGYSVKLNDDCIWSNGPGGLGGYCCEMFMGNLEVGNLVNPLGHSVDVGFGLERMVQIVEGCKKVEDSTMFDRNIINPKARIILNTLQLMHENGVTPSNKQQGYVCRLLIRTILPVLDLENDPIPPELVPWLENEQQRRLESLKLAKRIFNRHRDKDEGWWKDTHGITPVELDEIRNGSA